MYNYALIGNCQISALVSQAGSIDWYCPPRPDAPPVFGRMLDPDGGFFLISPSSNNYCTSQRYLNNTNIVVTTFKSKDGEFEIIDFCPRFFLFGRIHRPLSIFRIVRPIKGAPSLRVECSPVDGWSKNKMQEKQGNSHIEWTTSKGALRLTTNMPITYLSSASSFCLKEDLYFALTWGGGIEDDLKNTSEQFLKSTQDYWRTWISECSLPVNYQKETIRSALALKLHCFEDTGAILASTTTSLPEEIGGSRNWDYRFCWFRDAYYTLSALYHLGHVSEIENFLRYLLDVIHGHKIKLEKLAPVYTLDGKPPLPERQISNWTGYDKSFPVRMNNQAAEHVQNDIYGELILALTPIYLDERFFHLRTKLLDDLMKNLCDLCISSIGKKDAGLWEIREGWREHSFTNLMCWAGIDRISSIVGKGYIKIPKSKIERGIKKSLSALNGAVRSGTLMSDSFKDQLDASLSQLPMLRFPKNEISKKTLHLLDTKLSLKDQNKKPTGFYFRYIANDDFGAPQSSFIVCSYWMAQGHYLLGNKPKAKDIFNNSLKALNHVGLLSEHFDPFNCKQLGNFPQTYSHVGLINTAFLISPSWREVL